MNFKEELRKLVADANSEVKDLVRELKAACRYAAKKGKLSLSYTIRSDTWPFHIVELACISLREEIQVSVRYNSGYADVFMEW